jgi:hypothetical protein
MNKDEMREKIARAISEVIGSSERRRARGETIGPATEAHIAGAYATADRVLAALGLTEEWRRELFNAGYSYGIESEASPEEYDAAWKLYMQSGRIPQPPALGGIVEEIDGLLIELDATKEAAEAIPGLGAAKEVQDAEGNLAAALVNAWPTLRANLKQEDGALREALDRLDGTDTPEGET